MPSNSTRPKEERLARIRRNQQNSRDRKRARLLELEDKVKELQNQVISQPTFNSDSPSWSSRIDTLMLENAALRRLLHAVGIDDRGQTQFLQATIQSSTHESKPSLSMAAEKPTGDAHGSLGHSSPLKGSIAASVQNGSISSSWHQHVDILESPRQGSNVDPPLAQNMPFTSVDSPEFDDWLVDLEDLSNTTAGGPLLTEAVSALQTPLSEGTFSSLLSCVPQSRQAFPKISTPTSSLETAWQSSGGQDELPSTASCLLNASIPVSESDSTTLCSIALQMVFKHNKKRLTMSELDQRLRCGFREASEPAQECRVENHVLFNVLAEICV